MINIELDYFGNTDEFTKDGKVSINGVVYDIKKEESDPYKELKQAVADGKRIEFLSATSLGYVGNNWIGLDPVGTSVAFCYPPERYRIKKDSKMV
jgi:hypothetical protein